MIIRLSQWHGGIITDNGPVFNTAITQVFAPDVPRPALSKPITNIGAVVETASCLSSGLGGL